MTDHIEKPGRARVNRRQALRTGGVLGLAATSVALVGAGAQAAGTPADFPDPIGPFGRPVTGDTRARQRSRAAAPAPKQAGTGLETTHRLRPSGATIDSTPLANRTPTWTVEG
ncbi:hypothetical protein WEI85_04310 [Actinomycetes bacterium KLBMP 9797]